MTNPHEAAARERKVCRLVDAARDIAYRTGHDDPQAIATWLERADPDTWRALALVAGTRNPSDATISAVRARLWHVATRVAAADPFARL